MASSDGDRIRRMREDGLISGRQATLLMEGLRGVGSAATEAPWRPQPRRVPALAILAALVAVAIAAIALLAVVGQEPATPDTVQDVATTINQAEGVGAMNRSLMLTLVVLIAAALPAGLLLWTYNGLVSKEEAVLKSWGQVESNLQRRADLTPRLVESVTRYLRHEGETLTAVAAVRSGDKRDLGAIIDDLAEAANASAEALKGGSDPTEDAAALERLAAADNRMGAAITALVATVEAYPELRSSDQFLELQAQLEGTENRLNVARMRFNEEVGDYNAAIRRVPGALVAGLGRFRRKAYFQSSEEAREAQALGFE